MSTPDPEKPMQRYWFAAKRTGWGWGLPTAWQGWVVLLMFVALVGVLAFAVRPNHHAALFVFGIVVLVAALTAVCWLKGDPAGRRWKRVSE